MLDKILNIMVWIGGLYAFGQLLGFVAGELAHVFGERRKKKIEKAKDAR